MATFREELERLINSHSQENGSNTPDFILADYLGMCLLAFDTAVNTRERWYATKAQPGCREPWGLPHDRLEVDFMMLPPGHEIPRG